MEERVVTLSRLVRGLYLLCYLIVVGCLVGVGVAVWDSAVGAVVTIIAAVVLALAAGGSSWAVLSATRTRLVVGEQDVEIRNTFSSTVIARSDLRRFVIAPGGNWILAETFSGERTPVHAISNGLIWTARRRAARWNREFGLETE